MAFFLKDQVACERGKRKDRTHAHIDDKYTKMKEQRITKYLMCALSLFPFLHSSQWSSLQQELKKKRGMN